MVERKAGLKSTTVGVPTTHVVKVLGYNVGGDFVLRGLLIKTEGRS